MTLSGLPLRPWRACRSCRPEQAYLGADAGVDHLLDANGIADRAGAGTARPCVIGFFDDAHDVLRAARGGVVAVVAMTMRTAIQRLWRARPARPALGLEEKALYAFAMADRGFFQQDLLPRPWRCRQTTT